MTPTVTGAPDGADAAPAATLEVELVLEHATASMATAGTTAPNQRRLLSELRVISFVLSSLARGRTHGDLAGAGGDCSSFSGRRDCPWVVDGQRSTRQ